MRRFDLAITIAAVALVSGGVGFALGHGTAGKTATAASSSQTNGGYGGGQGGSGGGFRRGGFGARGTVTAVNGNTITMTGQNGATQTVNVSSSTSYLNGADRTSASLSDVTTGSTILASGQTSGNTIAATRITINPPAPGSYGGGGGAGSGSGSSPMVN